MTGNEYQKLAMRTNDGMEVERLIKKIKINETLKEYKNINIGEILNAALGLSGEVGELNDILKKWIFHEGCLDLEHAQKELGDILWYIALMCESFEWKLEDIMQMNVEKLMARYPEGFDIEKANYRKEGDL